MAWKTAGIKPLQETVKATFAKNGWRIILQRPLESQNKSLYSNYVQPGEKRNTAELIFLAGNPDPKKIRYKLTWLNEPGELSTAIVYLGKKMNYDIYFEAKMAGAKDLKEAED